MHSDVEETRSSKRSSMGSRPKRSPSPMLPADAASDDCSSSSSAASDDCSSSSSEDEEEKASLRQAKKDKEAKKQAKEEKASLRQAKKDKEAEEAQEAKDKEHISWYVAVYIIQHTPTSKIGRAHV